MSWLRKLIRRPDDVVGREIDEELRFHLDMRTRANEVQGMDAPAARKAAMRSFGDRDQVRAQGREILGAAPAARDGAGALEALLHDFRYGYRLLRRSPLATAAAILSLAIGIGANTANFSLVYGLLLRPLPLGNGASLVFLDAWNPERGDGDGPLTWADYERIRESGVFADLAGFTSRNLTVNGEDRPERIAGASVTPGLFEAIGVEPQLGRTLAPDDAAAFGFEEVVVISDGLWQRAFAADPDVVGRTLQVNQRELTVIGVMPPRFRFPTQEEVWLPLQVTDPENHTVRAARGVAVLPAGTSLAAAQAQLASLAAEAEAAWPDSHEGWTIRGMWFRNGFIDAGARQALYLMFGAVGLVLLLACANVANLQLSQAPARRRELSVRSALGASRVRLVRQLLAENVLLALAGGVVGIVVAQVWVSVVEQMIPELPAFWVDISMDRAALLYTVVISIGTGVLFGILPGLRASQTAMHSELRDSGRGSVSGRSAAGALVVAEVSFAVVLLVGALLMVRSFMQIQRADPGFDPGPLLSLRVVLAGDRYDDPALRDQYFHEVRQELESLPGVLAAAATGAIPADDGGADVRIHVEGGGPADEAFFATAIPSTEGFFEALGLGFLRGRDFTPEEARASEARVVILGSTLATRLWPGEDPLGRTIKFSADGAALQVIGVVPDLQYEEFGEDNAAAQLQVHVPYAPFGWRGMAVLVRTSGPPASAIDAVRDALLTVDPGQAPYDIMSMNDRRLLTSWGERFFGMAFAAYGGLAAVLALCGVYAVIAHSVAQRTREMGVRLALGARPLDVQSQVVGGAVRLAGAGIAIGVGFAWLLGNGLQGLLFGVSAHDPRVFAGVAGLLGAAAIAASFFPARRAARVDPTQALRAD